MLYKKVITGSLENLACEQEYFYKWRVSIVQTLFFL